MGRHAAQNQNERFGVTKRRAGLSPAAGMCCCLGWMNRWHSAARRLHIHRWPSALRLKCANSGVILVCAWRQRLAADLLSGQLFIIRCWRATADAPGNITKYPKRTVKNSFQTKEEIQSVPSIFPDDDAMRELFRRKIYVSRERRALCRVNRLAQSATGHPRLRRGGIAVHRVCAACCRKLIITMRTGRQRRQAVLSCTLPGRSGSQKWREKGHPHKMCRPESSRVLPNGHSVA